MAIEFMKHFARDPRVCGGRTVIKGTRVPLQVILASLADGDTIEEIVASFPTVTAEDVRAVIAFAAEGASEDEPVLGMPTHAD